MPSRDEISGEKRRFPFGAGPDAPVRLGRVGPSGVEISIDAAYENCPSAGYVPCRVRIENGSGSARTWDFDFSTRSGHYSQVSTLTLSRSLSVPAGQTSTFHVLVPVCPAHRNEGYVSSPSVTVRGFGVGVETIGLPVSGRGGRMPTNFVAMSPALAVQSWAPLRTHLDTKRKIALVGSEVDLSVMGEDWRALLGVSGFFVSVEEFRAMPPGQRRAVRTWVAQGGRVILCGDGDVAEWGSAGEAGGVHGLGHVQRLPWDGSSELPLEQTADVVQDLKDSLGDRLKDSSPVWLFTSKLGEPSRNLAFLSIFITLFAIVVGPLNLFWFAGSGRRHRLFWTTPLISVGASLLLGLVIVVQDGFGGSGVRTTLRLLFPEEKQVLVMQEQASRTGVLLSRGFPSGAADLFLSPLTVPAFLGPRQSGRNYQETARGYGGDWFTSRAVQGQFAEAFAPSRETVELVGVREGRPVVRSSVPVTLTDFYYIDDQGGRWTSPEVPTGEDVPLAQAGGMKSPMHAVSSTAGPMLRQVFASLGEREGFFYATTARPMGIKTLPAIRWKAEQTLCAGPLVPVP
jgi:hypothetical protein